MLGTEVGALFRLIRIWNTSTKGQQMMLLKKMSILLLLFITSGCIASYPTSISVENRARMKKVAVISLMGDDLCRVNVGTTVFNNMVKYWDVSGWDIDKFAAETVISTLSAKGGYEFVHCDPEKASIKSLYGSAKNLDHQVSIDNLIVKLQGISLDSNVDSFIVVKRRAMNFVPLAPDYIWGYGSTIFCRSVLKLPVAARLYAAFDIIVINARTMQVAAIGYDYARDRDWQEIESGFCKDELAELTPAQQDQIETKVKQILKYWIPARLDKLGL